MFKQWAATTLVAAAVIVAPSAVSAQQTGAPVQPPADATVVRGVDVTGQRMERTDTPDQMQRGRHTNPNDRVCRSITATGSRLGSRRVCRTRAEWDVVANEGRDAADQVTRNTRVPGT